MAPAFEGCADKDLEELYSQIGRDVLLAKANDICVIVQPSKVGAVFIVYKGCADAW